MLYKILVIDDQSEERRIAYKNLEKFCDEHVVTPPTFEIELVFVSSPEKAYFEIIENNISAIILDIVLNRPAWKSTRASDILSKVNDNIPIILVSSQWDSEEVRNLVSEIPTKNCRMFIHWDDFSNAIRIEEGSINTILLTLYKSIEEYKKTDHSLWLEHDMPIRILHLSDLQFGGFADWEDGFEAHHIATTVMKLWQEGPTFITITGDITHRGLPEEFNAAYEWIVKLTSQFKWIMPSNRILVVPGNHDICLSLATSSVLEFKKKDKKVDFIDDENGREDLLDYALRPYLDFSNKLTLRSVLSENFHAKVRDNNRFSLPWLDARYKHFGVIFIGFNSAQPIIPKLEPKTKVPKSTIELLIKEATNVLNEDGNNPLVIALSHHSPVFGDKKFAIENPEVLNTLFSDVPGLALWLHGHWHKRMTTDLLTPVSTRLVINSSPSLNIPENGRPPDSARGFSMIELQRKNNKVVNCRVFPIEWSGNTLQPLEEKSIIYERGKSGYLKHVEPKTKKVKKSK